MHENRHFLLYRKRRNDAENHVYICALRYSGESTLVAMAEKLRDESLGSVTPTIPTDKMEIDLTKKESILMNCSSCITEWIRR